MANASLPPLPASSPAQSPEKSSTPPQLTPSLDLQQAQQLELYRKALEEILSAIDKGDTLEIGNVVVTTSDSKDFDISVVVASNEGTVPATVNFTLNNEEISSLAFSSRENRVKILEQKILAAIKLNSPETTTEPTPAPIVPVNPESQSSQPEQPATSPASPQAPEEAVRAKVTLDRFNEYFGNDFPELSKRLAALLQGSQYNEVWTVTDTALAAAIERGQMSVAKAAQIVYRYLTGEISFDEYQQKIAVTSYEVV